MNLNSSVSSLSTCARTLPTSNCTIHQLQTTDNNDTDADLSDIEPASGSDF